MNAFSNQPPLFELIIHMNTAVLVDKTTTTNTACLSFPFGEDVSKLIASASTARTQIRATKNARVNDVYPIFFIAVKELQRDISTCFTRRFGFFKFIYLNDDRIWTWAGFYLTLLCAAGWQMTAGWARARVNASRVRKLARA